MRKMNRRDRSSMWARTSAGSMFHRKPNRNKVKPDPSSAEAAD